MGYTVVQDWMLQLPLDMTEVMIYATIYSFSQDGESTFRGSQNYLATKCKCCRDKVVKSLKRLVELGLVRKVDTMVNGVKLCEYTVFEEGCLLRIQDVVETYRGLSAGHTGGCTSERHNNKSNINKNIDKDITLLLPYESSRFSETWKTLCRQPKWKVKSHDALVMSLKKLANAESEEVAVRMMEDAIANGWQGLFAPREEKKKQKSESVYEHNMRVMEELKKGI